MTKLFTITVAVESDNDLSEVNLGFAPTQFVNTVKSELERQLSVKLCNPEVVEDTDTYGSVGMRNEGLTTFVSVTAQTQNDAARPGIHRSYTSASKREAETKCGVVLDKPLYTDDSHCGLETEPREKPAE